MIHILIMLIEKEMAKG
ncbi:hypothetical protein C210_05208 [Klebsiella pneumoniae subsp. pneumoniae KpMDU1]|nr:hypothetical protein C210_05208 [Klebsiella pneumoniae subsp. pneumoniae KpMDU1]